MIAKQISFQLGLDPANMYIKQSVVEEREADLLKQLEVAEETVDVLEQLLSKYAQEALRLQTYNELLRQMQKMSPPSAPAPFPPFSPQQPWVWPPQPSDFPTQKIWCNNGAGMDHVGIVAKEVPNLYNDATLLNAIVESIQGLAKRGE